VQISRKTKPLSFNKLRF